MKPETLKRLERYNAYIWWNGFLWGTLFGCLGTFMAVGAMLIL
jgi:hypothetical protein